MLRLIATRAGRLTAPAPAGAREQAISKPSMQTENEAWNAVLPQVGILKVFYEYASAIGTWPIYGVRPPLPPT